MAKVVIRLASKEDLPAVLELSKGIYGDNDYFLSEFPKFLNDPSRRILVAEKDGKVVGLQVIHIVDEGETSIVQGLRVHIKYRRQGIGERLIQECRNYVKENFPHVKFERYSVNSESLERLGIQKKLNDTLFHTVVFFACVVNGDASELSARLACYLSDQSTNVKKLEKIDFECVLNQGKLCNLLYRDTYIVHWQPFKARVSNVPHGLFMDGDSIFASYSGGSIESLSHSRWCPIEKCPQLYTVCYTLDKKLLQAHVVRQLENGIRQHPGETFLFVFIVAPSLVDCTSRFLLNDLSLKKLQDEFGAKDYYYLYFFEKFLI